MSFLLRPLNGPQNFVANASGCLRYMKVGSLLVGHSRQAPKQKYIGRPSSSSGLRSSMPVMRPSIMRGGRIGAPKAPAEVPLGTTQRVRQIVLHASSYMQSAVLKPCPIQIAAEQTTQLPICKLATPLHGEQHRMCVLCRQAQCVWHGSFRGQNRLATKNFSQKTVCAGV